MDLEREVKIGKVLKRKIAENKYSFRGLSNKAKVPYSTLFSWTEGRCPKDMIKAKRLADYLEISLTGFENNSIILSSLTFFCFCPLSL